MRLDRFILPGGGRALGVWLVIAVLCMGLCALAEGGESGMLERRKGGGGGGGGKGGKGGKGSGNNKGVTSSTGGTSASSLGFASGVVAGGAGVGAATSVQVFQPPSNLYGGARYNSVGYGQTVYANSLASNAPRLYYSSPPASSWPGQRYYTVYPYPWWAYGAGGAFVGGAFIQHSHHDNKKECLSELRNVTMLDNTYVPVYNNTDLFGDGYNVTYAASDQGIATIGLCPLGPIAPPNATIVLTESDCQDVKLDLVHGSVVQGNAGIQQQNDSLTMFWVRRGNFTANLRIVTVTKTNCSTDSDSGNGDSYTVLSRAARLHADCHWYYYWCRLAVLIAVGIFTP